MSDFDDDFYDPEDEELAKAVEKAFADTPYPKGDMVRSAYYQSTEMDVAFQDKHWKDVSPQLAYYYCQEVGGFTPEAFRFFFPSFLLAFLRHWQEAAIADVGSFLFYTLVPDKENEPHLNYLKAIAKEFKGEELEVVKRWIKSWLDDDKFEEERFGDIMRTFWGISDK